MPVDRTTDRRANRFPNKAVGRRDKMTAVSVSRGDGPVRILVTMEGPDRVRGSNKAIDQTLG